MDRMDADFHCFGTTDEDSDRFIISNKISKSFLDVTLWIPL